MEVGKGNYDERLLKAVDHAIEVYENERPQSVAEMREALGVFAPFLSAESKRLGARFLGRDFSPNAKDENGWTDLHYAAAGDWAEIAQFLVDAGAVVDAQMHGDREKITNAMANTLNKITNRDWSWWTMRAETPLHIAAKANADKTATLLLKEGADIARKNADGVTPLHWAALANADKTATLLLKNGADVDAKNADGVTPLHSAAWANADKTAALLLKNGADVDAKSADGITPLHSAAWANADKTATLLLENGADIAAKNDAGDTPLHDTVWGNADTTAAVLLKNGANKDARNNSGETPLEVAKRKGSTKVICLLENQPKMLTMRLHCG
ncbi:MAG: ankyrin repeat domain-containing protein [Gammaproteobacteria bacterium]